MKTSKICCWQNWGDRILY